MKFSHAASAMALAVALAASPAVLAQKPDPSGAATTATAPAMSLEEARAALVGAWRIENNGTTGELRLMEGGRAEVSPDVNAAAVETGSWNLTEQPGGGYVLNTVEDGTGVTETMPFVFVSADTIRINGSIDMHRHGASAAADTVAPLEADGPATPTDGVDTSDATSAGFGANDANAANAGGLSMSPEEATGTLVGVWRFTEGSDVGEARIHADGRIQVAEDINEERWESADWRIEATAAGGLEIIIAPDGRNREERDEIIFNSYDQVRIADEVVLNRFAPIEQAGMTDGATNASTDGAPSPAVADAERVLIGVWTAPSDPQLRATFSADHRFVVNEGDSAHTGSWRIEALPNGALNIMVTIETPRPGSENETLTIVSNDEIRIGNDVMIRFTGAETPANTPAQGADYSALVGVWTGTIDNRQAEFSINADGTFLLHDLSPSPIADGLGNFTVESTGAQSWRLNMNLTSPDTRFFVIDVAQNADGSLRVTDDGDLLNAGDILRRAPGPGAVTPPPSLPTTPTIPTAPAENSVDVSPIVGVWSGLIDGREAEFTIEQNGGFRLHDVSDSPIPDGVGTYTARSGGEGVWILTLNMTEPSTNSIDFRIERLRDNIILVGEDGGDPADAAPLQRQN